MHRRFALCVFLLALPGCVTTGGTAPSPRPVADTDAARLAVMLATELDRRARDGGGNLDHAESEMRALEAALFPPPVAEVTEPLPDANDLARIDISNARSLFHAIHIASYRDMATARAGWQTLSVMFPEVLEGLEPRVEAVDIPAQGLYLRLKAGPFLSQGAANEACAPFRAASVWCAPVDFTGETLTSASDG